MREFFINISRFGALSVVFYLVALFAFGVIVPWVPFKPNLNYRMGSYGHMHTRLKEIKQVNDIDILFLGSSHAYRGFDVRIFEKFGFNSFNLGSSAQTPLQTQLLLERYLDGLSPKLVIYEVYPSTLSNEGIESSLDIIANDKIDRRTWSMVVKLCHTKTTNSFLYALMREALNLDEGFQEPVAREEDTYISGGYVEREISYFRHKKGREKEWRIDDEQFAHFAKVIDMFNKRNIPVVLVNAPITSGQYKSYTNNREIDQKIGQFAPYYNFNELMSLDDSLNFYDASHLNQNGVEEFNRKLIEVLEKDKLLKRSGR